VTVERPTLVGSRVVLVPLGPEHAEGLFASANDPEGRRLTGTHATFTRERIERWCAGLHQRDDRVDLAITAEGRFVGEVVLNELDRANQRSGFRISLAGPAVFGQGYGTEATRLLLAHAFDAMELHRVELEVYPFNPRAIRVYEKVGFRREGLRRESLFWEGAWFDAIQMGMLAGELVRS
jgi:RimJ/RimL family protein N-acetyltransferase